MRKLAIIPFLALLASCALPAGLALPPAPAPAAHTVIDDRALEVAWKTFDVAIDAINVLVQANVIKPGTPRAKTIATAIRRVNMALVAAEHADKIASVGDYAAAIKEATEAMADIHAALAAGEL